MKIQFARFTAAVLALASTLAIAAPVHAQSKAPVANAVPGPRVFPLEEPMYAAKRVRDLGPFMAALAGFSPQRRTELDAELAEATIPMIQRRMAAGELSSRELVLYYLDRIRRYDIDRLNAIMELNPNALTIAEALDAERAEGRLRGGMHGIPVLIKDNIATGDRMHTTAGAYALKDWCADRDARLVKNLRQSGAVILGKANLSEWANYLDPGMPNGFSTLGGQTRHPYGPFDPLGSSSGSAVAVTANLTAVSVGSETQGSILRPAQTNGVVGLKTSHGLVSGDYVIPLVDWMDVPGPIGRTVTDVAVLLSALVSADDGAGTAADPAITSLRNVDFTRFLTYEAARRLRVGVAVYPDAAIDTATANAANPPADASDIAVARLKMLPEILRSRNRDAQVMLSALGTAGVPVVQVDAGTVPPAPAAAQVIQYGFKVSLNGFLAGLPNAPVTSLEAIIAVNQADPQNRIPYGQGYLLGSQKTDSGSDVYAAAKTANQAAARTGLDRLFAENGIDVLIAPGGSQVYAAAGHPALTIPVGFEKSGEPRGTTMIGRYLGEPDLLAVGYVLEQSLRARKPPDLEAVLATLTAPKPATTSAHRP